MKSKSRKIISKQHGSVLIVSLVLLLVITILGLANIRTAAMEMRMSNSLRDRNQTFEAAETVLKAVERDLALNPPLLADVLSTCIVASNANCFNPVCDNNGLCFDGALDTTDIAYDSEFKCTVAPNAGTTKRTEYWSDTSLNVWGTVTKHSEITISGVSVKYIKEFVCFVNPTGGSFGAADQSAGEQLFRITAYAEGNVGSQVMLQSTYLAVGTIHIPYP